MDVPLKKSHRRQLRQRAGAYFFDELFSLNLNESTATTKALQELLDDAFFKGGTLAARSVSLNHDHTKIVLYLRSRE